MEYFQSVNQSAFCDALSDGPCFFSPHHHLPCSRQSVPQKSPLLRPTLSAAPFSRGHSIEEMQPPLVIIPYAEKSLHACILFRSIFSCNQLQCITEIESTGILFLKCIASDVRVVVMPIAMGFNSIWLFAVKIHYTKLLEHITSLKLGTVCLMSSDAIYFVERSEAF